MKIYRNRWARLGRDDDKGGEGGAGGGGGDTKPADDAGGEGGDTKPADDAGKGDDDGKPLGPAGERALARVKAERDEARAKLKEIDDAKLSKEEKLTRDHAEITTKLTDAETRVAKFEIALDKNLTKSQALRLVGTTREELEADADQLIEDLGIDTAKPADKLRKKPTEKLKGGGAPNDDEGEMDPAKLAAAAKARAGHGGVVVS
jgi:uncharacterized protein (DUF885 family)